MQILTDPLINDDLSPDYKIYWENPNSSQKGNCTVFTYGEGKEIAIATFQILYPECELLNIEEFRKVG